eukprot:gb/GFBE01054658.1/.p1 GENE.gb/GFBE01054658.1/~~gb/GFBE01054658.1/.p1  ORF type:complete len:335 (+),score=73.82 gb/GFBE01054658.1/:1-1005(+)
MKLPCNAAQLLLLAAALLLSPFADAIELTRVGMSSDGEMLKVSAERGLVRNEKNTDLKAPQDLKAALEEKGVQMLELACKAMFKTYFIDTKLGTRYGIAPDITKQLAKQGYCKSGQFDMHALLASGTHTRSFWTTGDRFQEDMLKISSTEDLATAWAHSQVWNLLNDGVKAAGQTQNKADAYTLILEADALLRNDFERRLSRLGERMSESSFPAADVIYLGTCDEQCPPDYEQGLDIGEGVFVVRAFHPDCSHSYLLSAAGATKLVAAANPKLEYPVGKLMLSSFLEGNVDSLVLCPPITRLTSQPDFPNVLERWQRTIGPGEKSWAVKFDKGV